MKKHAFHDRITGKKRKEVEPPAAESVLRNKPRFTVVPKWQATWQNDKNQHEDNADDAGPADEIRLASKKRPPQKKPPAKSTTKKLDKRAEKEEAEKVSQAARYEKLYTALKARSGISEARLEAVIAVRPKTEATLRTVNQRLRCYREARLGKEPAGLSDEAWAVWFSEQETIGEKSAHANPMVSRLIFEGELSSNANHMGKGNAKPPGTTSGV